jgi:hypothetical protein
MHGWQMIYIRKKKLIRPRKPSLYPTEAQEQMVFVKRVSYYPDIHKHLAANANGGSRHLLEAYNLKRQGVKKGVSDLFFSKPYHGYHGLWIEMKRRKGAHSVLSIEQKEWINLKLEVGYAAIASYGAEEAWEHLMQYIEGTIRCHVYPI